MGESVAEGTIVRWLKKVGDPVERDEPLFEISTDKVDAEIPSPIAGVLSEIKAKEGETVPINTVVGVIDEVAGASAKTPPAFAAGAATAGRLCTRRGTSQTCSAFGTYRGRLRAWRRFRLGAKRYDGQHATASTERAQFGQAVVRS